MLWTILRKSDGTVLAKVEAPWAGVALAIAVEEGKVTPAEAETGVTITGNAEEYPLQILGLTTDEPLDGSCSK